MKKIAPLFLLLALFAAPASAEDKAQNSQPFATWLQEFEKDALAKGIKQETLDEAFADTEPLDRVIELDHKQPESVRTLPEYLASAVSAKRVTEGRKNYAQNRTLLNKIGKKYGVQPKYIVALWGIETNFGKTTGGFRTIDALATLAYDGRRSDFFRDELIKALKILQEEDMAPEDLRGSWAGALGQCQFMPTSFLLYAVDYNHDGRRDIWDSKGDVFASIANYLKSSGWNAGESWGREVSIPDDFDRSLMDVSKEKPLSEWRRLGVRKADGKPLPDQKINASLILVGEGDDAVPYIVYGNFKVLLKWNRSRMFATAVSTLADKLGQ